MTGSLFAGFSTSLAIKVTLLMVLASLPLEVGVAQGVARRTPNLSTTWSPERGVVQFNFTHRFDMSHAPLRKITNTPSFHVATGLTGSLGAGLTYGSNSDLVSAYPNEWEFFARWSPLRESADTPLDASLQGGWNVAAESFDMELSAARDFGALRVLVAGRAFTNAFYSDTARYAVAGGAALRVSPWLSVAGDYATLIDRADAEHPAWGLGLQLSVPYTPHSMSLHASNVGTGSLEGASRGTHTRWGFEYTVPITLRRYAQRSSRAGIAHQVTAEANVVMTGAVALAPDTVVVRIQQFRYQSASITVKAGDVVVWRNDDLVEHTLTADAGAFESPLIKPGQQWSFRFAAAGTYAYHCMPHPFMKAAVLVKEATP